MQNQPLIRARGLARRYLVGKQEVRALDGVDLDVARGEFVTLKAMGASRSDIRQMFMMEAGLIGLMGGVVGLVSSWVLGRGLNRAALWYANKRDLPLPENLFIITPTLAVEALFFALLIGVLAGLDPANRASTR